MNGAAFQVRHKEWAIETIQLAFRTLPWMFIFSLPIFLILYFLEASLVNSTSLPAMAFNMVVMGLLAAVNLFTMITGPTPHIFSIIMHRMDREKTGPFGLAWYACDKIMWEDHLAPAWQRFKPIILMMIVLTFGLCIGALFAPKQPPKIDEGMEMARAFWQSHPFLLIFHQYADHIVTMCAFYFAYMTYINRYVFNIFMQANGYKPHHMCKSEAASALPKLRKLFTCYSIIPMGFVCLANIFGAGSLRYPAGALVIDAALLIITIWSMHASYIIGRDYYIGPPKKRQEQEDTTKFHATA